MLRFIPASMGPKTCSPTAEPLLQKTCKWLNIFCFMRMNFANRKGDLASFKGVAQPMVSIPCPHDHMSMANRIDPVSAHKIDPPQS
jgi:hypothetical protein